MDEGRFISLVSRWGAEPLFALALTLVFFGGLILVDVVQRRKRHGEERSEEVQPPSTFEKSEGPLPLPPEVHVESDAPSYPQENEHGAQR